MSETATEQRGMRNKMKMDQEKLHDFVSKHQDNICCIEARQNGRLIYSDYWNNMKATDSLHVTSVTKSVVSILIGIAIDQGLIKSVDQPVLDFFPDYAVKRGEKTIQSITVSNLLSMTAPYKYRTEPWTKVCSTPDWVTASLDLLGGKSGNIGDFRYSTLGLNILAGILTKVSGMRTVDYANKFLFEPIGVSLHRALELRSEEEHKAFVTEKKPKDCVWISDAKGVAAAGFGLCLTVEEMVKIGQLCLDGGAYNGKKIVSSKWIEESTRPRVECSEKYGNMHYGYLWWIPYHGRKIYAALGDSGNVIYMDADRNLVIAILNTFKPSVLNRIRFIYDYIEPLIEAYL